MIKSGDVLILLVLVVVLFLTVAAIKRGYTGIKESKTFDTSDKKIRVGYWLTSVVHMWAGIFIASCYVIAVLFIIISLLGR